MAVDIGQRTDRRRSVSPMCRHGVPPEDGEEGESTSMFLKKILVPLDGSSSSERHPSEENVEMTDTTTPPRRGEDGARSSRANSFSRRRALRLLGTGVMLGVPLAALVRTVSAERAPIAVAASPTVAPAPEPAAPTPPSPPQRVTPTHVPAPAAASAPPALPARLATVADTPLWADIGGRLPLGIAPAGAIFEPLAPPTGPLVQVRDAYSGATSYVDRSNLTAMAVPATLAAPGRWWGQVTVDGANLRSAPRAHAQVVGHLPAGSPLVVSAWVEGDQVVADNPAWAQLKDHTFIYSAEMRPVDVPSAPAIPDDVPISGRWIDVNLTQQVVVAYEGRALVRMARTSTGRPGFETTPGAYVILRRVASETMTSAGVVGTNGQTASYSVPHVRWTQYFSADGKALHENYWKPTDQFGIPSSHGCAGLLPADAQFLWDWASVGTPVLVHA